MASGRNRFYFPPPEVVDSTPVDKAATIADGINYFPQTITDSLVQGYTGNTSTGHNTSDLSTTMANVDNRITELEGGGVRFTITSSTTIDVTAYQTLKVIMIGSSQSATHNVNGPRFGDIGGVPGGFISGEISTDTLSALGYDLTAVPVVVGTGGGQSYLGNSTLGYVMRTVPGRADKGDRMGADATTSGPGKGGNGGNAAGTDSNGYLNGSGQTAGFDGVSSVLADGGAGGVLPSGTSVAGNPGSNGGVATINGPFPCGGAGGGGGSAGKMNTLFGTTYNGGDGGHGGFPGGGPGAGGAGSGNSVSATFGNSGASGARANGVILIDAA